MSLVKILTDSTCDLSQEIIDSRNINIIPLKVCFKEEVYLDTKATRHGFYAYTGVDDPAKRFKPTMYAMARGAWYSPVEAYRGNGFWFMRTNGYSESSVTYICDMGYIYEHGTDVMCADSGILPVICVDSAKVELRSAGRSSSTEILEN